MIPLLLLAFGHWSSCAPVYIPKYGTHKYYEQPVCSYRWVDAPRLPDTKLQSPQIWLDIAAQWTVNPQGLKSGDWYVVAEPYKPSPLLAQDIDPSLIGVTSNFTPLCGGGELVNGKCELSVMFPEDAVCTHDDGGGNVYTCRWKPVAPQSQCYIPGEAHNELDVPCVRVDQ